MIEFHALEQLPPNEKSINFDRYIMSLWEKIRSTYEITNPSSEILSLAL